MGVFADGNPWGLPDGLVSSFPVRCGGGVWEFADGFRLSEEASRQLDESVAVRACKNYSPIVRHTAGVVVILWS